MRILSEAKVNRVKIQERKNKVITHLNPNSNSWTKIYSIDLEGYSPDKFESLDDYLVKQIDSIVSNQFEIGYILRAMTPPNNFYILVFTPHSRR